MLGDIMNTEIDFNMALVVSGVVELDTHYRELGFEASKYTVI